MFYWLLTGLWCKISTKKSHDKAFFYAMYEVALLVYDVPFPALLGTKYSQLTEPVAHNVRTCSSTTNKSSMSGIRQSH